MTGRAPLHALLLLESVHAMAASATRGVWQRCVRELTRPCRSASSATAVEAVAAAGKAASRTPRSVSCGSGSVPEQSILLPSFSWGRARAGAAAAAARTARAGSRLYNWTSSGSLISSEKVSSGEHFSRLYAMQFSTDSAQEQNASENVPAENLTSAGPAVVVAVDASSSELEFAPDNESTPSTPLVQAIQSQEAVSAEDVSSSVSPHEHLRDVFSDDDGSSLTLRQTDSDRVVQPGRIYIGGLPFGMKGDDLRHGLRELCGQYGVVTDVSLAQHRNQSHKSIAAGKHRGFAFVMMETSEQAQEVIEKLNGTTVWGRVLMVSYGLKRIEPDPSERIASTVKTAVRCKVFVGNLHEGTSRMDLLAKFQQYGAIVDVKLITELHSSRSRGFAFLTFAEEGQAVKAVLDTDGSILDGSVIRVNIAKYPQGY